MLEGVADGKSAVRKLIVTFVGWSDAGFVSSHVGGILIAKLRAKVAAQIKGFFNMTSSRPYLIIKDGVVRSLREPSTTFWLSDEYNLLISQGPEPDLDWSGYIEKFFKVLEDFNVEQVYTVGSFYDRVSHRMPQRISAVISSEKLKAEIPFSAIDYEGPGSIHSFLVFESGKMGKNAMTLWTSVPVYVTTPYFIGIDFTLRELSNILGISIELEDVSEMSKSQYAEFSKRMVSDPEFSSIVEEIEKRAGFILH